MEIREVVEWAEDLARWVEQDNEREYFTGFLRDFSDLDAEQRAHVIAVLERGGRDG